MKIADLKVITTPKPNLAMTNRVYVNKTVFTFMENAAKTAGLPVDPKDPGVNITVGDWVYEASYADGVGNDEIALNSFQRTNGSHMLNVPVPVSLFIVTADEALAGLTIALDLVVKKAGLPRIELDCDELSNSFKAQFKNQVFRIGAKVAMDFNGTKYELIIDSLEHADVGGVTSNGNKSRGQILATTSIQWKKQQGAQTPIVFTGQTAANARNDSLFKKDFDFQNMGIGGLNAQFQTMFRRAFASRIFPGLVKQLGINHVRGILLYGPPGCGKTLIARQIGKVLNAREPKIINGPEVLNKFVGGSEEKIRELFYDAEKEQNEMGDASMLHIIIFDEMDAIMKKRGSSSDSTGVSDSIVNQLLSKIDGVDSLNNILIIGMTNRKDMIDEAIIRPGRLEVHIEISLPNEEGRTQILNIHTAEMKKNNRIANEAIEKLPDLAAATKNYTGAEIEGLVRGAASYALARNVDASVMKGDMKDVKVEWKDFDRALRETIPAFGSKDNEEIKGHARNGICEYGSAFEDLWNNLQKLVKLTEASSRTPLLSVLLEGAVGTGKTAVAAEMCVKSGFPFVRMISADGLIGYSEHQKCQHLLKIFSDSYKSSLSIIFIDDIERIIEFSPVGMRFSNVILQTLLVLIRRVPPKVLSLVLVLLVLLLLLLPLLPLLPLLY